MDKREMLDRLAANGDERLLLGRVWDKYEQCRRRNLPQGTGFLSPAEQAAAQRLLNALSVSEGYTFWGGYDGAQRRQLWFLPDWQEAPEEDAVRVVRASFYEEDSLTHRDILGSLMALGVTRETLGDILVSPRWADVLATGPAAELLLSEWTAAGRVRLHTASLPLEDLIPPEEKVKHIRDTVSSLRLDAVCSTGFRMARGKAADLISSGHVQVNWRPCTKADKLLTEGDTVSARGFGKFQLAAVGGVTKKGRTAIVVKRYI